MALQYAQRYFPNDFHLIDLENPADIARLQDPLTALAVIPQKLIVIDEIQRMPELFPVLRIVADKVRGLAGGGMEGKLFLLLGSASGALLNKSSESLLGRIGYVELCPFSITEVDDTKRLLYRGGFPLSYFAPNDEESQD